MNKEQLTLAEMLEKWPELGDPEIPQVDVSVSALAPTLADAPVAEVKLKLCAECHWVSVPHSREVDRYKCFAPANAKGIHLVDGSRTYWHPLCIDQRAHKHLDVVTCGPDGNWWKEYTRPAVMSACVVEEPTIGGKTATNLELVSDNSPKKYKVPKLNRLSKTDLDSI